VVHFVLVCTLFLSPLHMHAQTSTRNQHVKVHELYAILYTCMHNHTYNQHVNVL